MKRLGLTLCSVFLVLGVAVPAAGADAIGSWAGGPNLPAAMTRFDGELYNGRVYVLGFRDSGGGTDGSIWYYDLAGAAWTDTGLDMPVPVSNYTIAMLTDGTGVGLYVFGGRDSTGVCANAVQVYYPATNTTATVATDPWTGNVGGVLVFPGGVAVTGNKAYVWGGYCSGTSAPYTSDQTWIFDPAAAAGTRWSGGPALPAPGGYQTSAVVDGMVYSIGGDTYDGTSLFAYDTVLTLDPANLGAGWQTKAALPMPSSGVAGCDESRAFGFDTGSGWLLAGRIVLAGCGQWPAALADNFLYDVAADTWSTFPGLITARRNQMGVWVPISATTGYMWVGGGYDSSGVTAIDTTEVFNLGVPTSVSLTSIESRAAAGAGAMLLPLGLAVIAALAVALVLRRR